MRSSITPALFSVLAIGDQFIPASSYRSALEQHVGASIALREITWEGDKSAQHTLQQVMEQSGVNAIPTPSSLSAEVAHAEALCLHFAPIGDELIAAAPALKLIAVARSGLENIDIEAATARGIGVVPSHGRNAGAVAELQIALMLAEARNVARADASIKSGGWRKEFPGERVEIAGRTVGMIGFGHVGRVFARRLSGFAPLLLAYDPYADTADLVRCGVEPVDTLGTVCARSDFVIVQAKLTPETTRFIGTEQFQQMKQTAYFINVSRSRLVDTSALVDVLKNGRIGGAGLDVFDDEPLGDDHPLRNLDNVTLTTHFGGDTVDTNRISAAMTAAAVMEFARTGRVAGAVNAAALGWS
jgi:D-3-phosphoglycerate dehydrogenase